MVSCNGQTKGRGFSEDAWSLGGFAEMSNEELQEELTLVRRQLRDAMKLLQTAESGLIGNANIVWEQRREELEQEYEK
jgi:hypothetical protein